MPEHPKNTLQKNKNEPKEQRRRRQNRHSGPVEKDIETNVEIKKVSEKKPIPKVVEPPPEFYKNLKRDTEEILKITEEEHSKYKKKEIQSNWAKYEMPIESYEEIDQQESVGVDFESLIQASLSVGGHFQFKHEKSWDISSGPSPYDKYFDINMDNLSIALSSIPFYERNNIDTSLFSETDVQTMNHRAAKYKHKYFNDKKYITPEIESENRILNLIKAEEANNAKENEDQDVEVKVDLEKISLNNEDSNKELKETSNYLKDLVNQTKADEKEKPEIDKSNKNKDEDDLLNNVLDIKQINKDESKVTLGTLQQDQHVKENKTVPENESKNPVIESPEDLEKWLDDFLDG